MEPMDYVCKIKTVHPPGGGDRYIPFVWDSEGRMVETTWEALHPDAREHAERALCEHIVAGATKH
jgi:hypothetical protein